MKKTKQNNFKFDLSWKKRKWYYIGVPLIVFVGGSSELKFITCLLVILAILFSILIVEPYIQYLYRKMFIRKG